MINYISFFSGIGGFEVAINNIFEDSNCLGFSEIDKFAISVYEKHFPTHFNLGDITKIKKKDIKKICSKTRCDLVVGGFPCQDLSSMNRLQGDGHGLSGKRSGLFYDFIKILGWIKQYNSELKIIIENNGSMKKMYQDEISKILNTLFDNKVIKNNLNGKDFGLQRRNRIYWTNFSLNEQLKEGRIQNWNDILLNDNLLDFNYFNTKQMQIYNEVIKPRTTSALKLVAQKYPYFKLVKSRTNGMTRFEDRFSSTSKQFCLPILGHGNYVMIEQKEPLIYCIRKFHPIEIERLFFLPDGYTSKYVSKTRAIMLLGNCVIVKVIEYILKNLKEDIS